MKPVSPKIWPPLQLTNKFNETSLNKVLVTTKDYVRNVKKDIQSIQELVRVMIEVNENDKSSTTTENNEDLKLT